MGILDKTRDMIHEKVASDDQLLNEKPTPDQLREKMPNNQHEIAEAIDNTIDSVKARFNERLDEGTERADNHKQESSGPGLIGGVKNKIYEATKAPDVKEREEFRDSSVTEKLGKLSSNETNESIMEVFSSK
jgi:hypothetical protein